MPDVGILPGALSPPRILLIDSYDSFTLNLAALCRKAIPDCLIHIAKNDALPPATLLAALAYFDAVIVGPGPGSPESPEDIGVLSKLWDLSDDELLPIFGVCLGLQSLALKFGARLRRLRVVKHGQISAVIHCGEDIFRGVGEVRAVRYHSLHVEVLEGGEVITLAWADDEGENGRVVMGIKHVDKPFYGVQYHPESVKTEGGGVEVLGNFWSLAKTWNRSRRITRPWDIPAHKLFGHPWPPRKHHLPSHIPALAEGVHSIALAVGALSVADICEELGVKDQASPFVLLDSAARPGRFTIIGATDASTLHITYRVGHQRMRIRENGIWRHESLALYNGDAWSWLSKFMSRKRVLGGDPNVPFWGGLVGYLSYELGVGSLGVSANMQQRRSPHPDINMVYLDRSLVFDNQTSTLYVQSLISNDPWVNEMSSRLLTKCRSRSPSSPAATTSLAPGPSPTVTVHLPDKDGYLARINAAKENLFSGNSYELCLTAQTRVVVSKPCVKQLPLHHGPSSWRLFKSLRATNPAPYSAYFRLGATHFVSSSPERFLSYDRSPSGRMQLRPIKGTLRRSPDTTRQIADEKLANNKKEVAENLMIVDLIRHDLHGVLGENVWVNDFCRIEEYETVWQMVSVIEGQLPEGRVSNNIGWDVLHHSLPPGSMTGAPKKRSVEILQSLEDDARGIYSGVFGYWCVSGGGDWAVTIRSCFKHDRSPEGTAETTAEPSVLSNDHATCASGHDDGPEEWIIGAGGAITALSEPEAEWDEMLLKLNGVLKAFDVTTF